MALKIALTAFSPMEVMAYRMLTACLVFAPALPSLWRYIHKRGKWKYIVPMVLSEPCLFFIFETHALQYTSASQAGMISALLPLNVTIAAYFLLKEKTTKNTWIGLSLTLIGIFWLSMDNLATESAPNPLLGNMLEITAIFCSTIYVICARYLSRYYHTLEITGMQIVSGTIFFGVMALMPLSTPQLTLSINIPTYLPLLMIIYTGTAVTFVGYSLYNYGLKHLSTSKVSTYCNLMPLVSLVLDITVLGESISLVQYAASVLVILGLIISLTAKTHTQNTTS